MMADILKLTGNLYTDSYHLNSVPLIPDKHTNKHTLLQTTKLQ